MVVILLKNNPRIASLTLFSLTEPDLLERIAQDADWTESRLADVIKRLLAVLMELRALKVLHLDIKVTREKYASFIKFWIFISIK